MIKYGKKVTIKFKVVQEENLELKSDLEQALEKVRLLESQKNYMTENLATESQKLEETEQEIENMKTELQTVKSAKVDLQGD